jgi:hypothetical protein
MMFGAYNVERELQGNNSSQTAARVQNRSHVRGAPLLAIDSDTAFHGRRRRGADRYHSFCLSRHYGLN